MGNILTLFIKREEDHDDYSQSLGRNTTVMISLQPLLAYSHG
jgi:hypothetical protein